MDEELLKKAKQVAYRHLARSPRSRVEVERRLREKGYPNPIVLHVIQQLEEYRYLDDKTFARQWARDRSSRYHWGPSRLRIELERRGVDREWIEEALRELFVERDEESRVAELIGRRLKGRGLRDPREYRRCSDYLFRRGYSPEAIQSVLRRMKKDSDMADD